MVLMQSTAKSTDRPVPIDISEPIAKITHWVVNYESGKRSFARITMLVRGKQESSQATGVGPIDALFRATEAVMRHGAKIIFYSVTNRGGGSDATAVANVSITKDEITFDGVGTGLNTIGASVLAIEDALNKLMRNFS